MAQKHCRCGSWRSCGCWLLLVFVLFRVAADETDDNDRIGDWPWRKEWRPCSRRPPTAECREFPLEFPARRTRSYRSTSRSVETVRWRLAACCHERIRSQWPSCCPETNTKTTRVRFVLGRITCIVWDVAYCYRRSCAAYPCLSVCLYVHPELGSLPFVVPIDEAVRHTRWCSPCMSVTFVSPAITAEPIER